MKNIIIGVTGPDHGGNTAWRFTAFALRLSGARAIRLTPSREPFSHTLDAIVIGGGSDIDPSLYGENPHEATVHLDHRRDEMEWRLLEENLSREIPIMGICRGAQMINVFHGGTLNQHIFDEDLEYTHKKTPLPYKKVYIKPHTKLHAILQSSECIVNSIHHQSMERTGEGLIHVAFDENRIPQAIEHTTHPFLIGVQWHPEYMLQKVQQRALFKALVEQTKKGKKR